MWKASRSGVAAGISLHHSSWGSLQYFSCVSAKACAGATARAVRHADTAAVSEAVRPRRRVRASVVLQYGGGVHTEYVHETGEIEQHRVRIEVHATSVNALDVAMARGYGKAVFEPIRGGRGNTAPMPLTLGLDCAGVVVEVGSQVLGVRPGDAVVAVKAPSLEHDGRGCHAEYVDVHQHLVVPRPCGLNTLEAASLPYAGLTAMAAVDQMNALPGHNVLVIGGSGGVGSIAVQLLKKAGCSVSTISSAANMKFCKQLGSAHTFAYDSPADCYADIPSGSFDAVLDAGPLPRPPSNVDLSPNLLRCLRPRGASYVTVSPPWLAFCDENNSIFLGSAKAWSLLLKMKTKLWVSHSLHYNWAFFSPSRMRLQRLLNLGLDPHIAQVFDLEDSASAYRCFDEAHLHGKIMLSTTKHNASSA